MITGVVQPGRQPIVRVHVKGTRGRSLDVEAILDTGFTEAFSLPQVSIQALGLRFINTDHVILADGKLIAITLYEGTVVWGGQDRNVVVHCLEGDPLIGMLLVYDHRLTMDAVDNGPISLVPFP
jgi:predicted aspartyl protease